MGKRFKFHNFTNPVGIMKGPHPLNITLPEFYMYKVRSGHPGDVLKFRMLDRREELPGADGYEEKHEMRVFEVNSKPKSYDMSDKSFVINNVQLPAAAAAAVQVGNDEELDESLPEIHIDDASDSESSNDEFEQDSESDEDDAASQSSTDDNKYKYCPGVYEIH